MSNDWDTYFCHVDDKPASMLLDLGIARVAPMKKLPVMACVSLDIQDPDENGFSKRGEYERLIAIEDALVPALSNDKDSVFVGRCTTGGQRDFFFYLADASGLSEKTAAIMKPFTEYVWNLATHKEPEWDTYFDFLFPDEENMNVIQNNRVRRGLEENGDDTAKPRPVDHWVLFSAEADRNAFCAQALEEGFSIGATDAKDPQTTETPFEVTLGRVDAPAELDDVTWELKELAGAHGGVYDGWGCAVAR